MKLLILLCLLIGVALANRTKIPIFRDVYKKPLVELHIPKGRVLDGFEAEPHSIPYQAFLKASNSKDNWYCGGSLITTKAILTAAHCIDDADKVIVILGAHNVNEKEPSQVIMQSSKMIMHPNYDPDELTDDIGIIHLPSSVHLNEFIKTVPLPLFYHESYTNKMGVVSGWGQIDGHNRTLSQILRWTSNLIISNEECNEFFHNVPSTQICLDGLVGQSCIGDSGGPLTVDGVQVGVVSYGVKFCPTGYPAVFTRVSKYLEWIGMNV